MRRFRFALDPVLRLRSSAADAARDAFAQAVRARLAREQDVATAQADLDAALQDAERRGVPVHRLGGVAAHRAASADAHRAALAGLDAAQMTERTARAALADAMRRVDALDQLRTTAETAHRADADRADLAGLDDIATARRAHTARSSQPAAR